MTSEMDSGSRREVHLPPVDPSKRGVLETRSGRPRSAPFAELQLSRAEDAMDFLPELPGAGRSLIAGSSDDRASTPSGKVRASAFAAATPSSAAAVPDDAGARRREKSSLASSAVRSGGDSAGAAALTVGLYASTATDAARVDSAGRLCSTFSFKSVSILFQPAVAACLTRAAAGPAPRSTGDSASGSSTLADSHASSAAPSTLASRCPRSCRSLASRSRCPQPTLTHWQQLLLLRLHVQRRRCRQANVVVQDGRRGLLAHHRRASA